MWIFFGLRNPYLFFVCFGQGFSQGLANIILVINYLHSFIGIIVVGHGYIIEVQFVHVEFMHVFLT